MNTKGARVIMVLGMHRSGTSALAGSLQEQGVYLGKVFEESPHNKKGNRENAEIMQLNESVLAFSNGSWDVPPHSITWNNEHVKSRDHIVEGFTDSGHPLWGFKDPRSLFTLDFWLDGLKAITDIVFVGTFRHPLAVAKSLMTRNNKPINEGLVLWETYNTRLLEIQKKYPFPLVSFDVEPDEYRKAVIRITNKLGLRYNHPVDSPFFETTLRHETFDSPVEISENTLNIYHELMKIYEEQQ